MSTHQDVNIDHECIHPRTKPHIGVVLHLKYIQDDSDKHAVQYSHHQHNHLDILADIHRMEIARSPIYIRKRQVRNNKHFVDMDDDILVCKHLQMHTSQARKYIFLRHILHRNNCLDIEMCHLMMNVCDYVRNDECKDRDNNYHSNR